MNFNQVHLQLYSPVGCQVSMMNCYSTSNKNGSGTFHIPCINFHLLSWLVKRIEARAIHFSNLMNFMAKLSYGWFRFAYFLKHLNVLKG